jgi:diguanylate cyclase (GGDEF)-like protein
MPLDIVTLRVVSLLFAALIAAVLAGIQRTTHGAVPGLREWALACALWGAGMAGLLSREFVPAWIAVVGANAALVASFGLLFLGVRRFQERALPWRAPVVFGAAVIVFLCLFTYVDDSFAARAVIVAGAQAALYLAAARDLTRRIGDRSGRAAYRYTAAALCVGAGAAMVRIAAVILTIGSPPHLQTQGAGDAIYIVVNVLDAVAIGFGLIMLAHVRLRAQLQFLASHDSLTDAYTRRVFLDLCARELARARRGQTPVAVLMLDLDLFKRVNDTHGHLAGDMVLRRAAAELRSTLRSHDVLGRYGGEEFTVLLPGVAAAEAMVVAERARARIAATEFGTPAVPIRITVSVGVAISPDGRGSVEGLVALADDLLYQAKDAGRDRVVGPAIIAPVTEAVLAVATRSAG